MTDILCEWLEKEVKVSRKVEPTNFAREFSTGYLIGEVLNKYQLQDDFDQFSQSRTSDSKLNNFTRIEPVLHLLAVPYDTNIARDIMTEKQGIATRLMYQVFIAIKKKEKNNLTGVAMETMRPAAPVKLEAVESLMYKERLKHMTPRQTDLNLDALVSRFHEHQTALESTAFRERFLEQERHEQMLQEKRQELLNNYRDNHARKSEMLARIKAATVHIPKPPPNRTAAAIAERRAQRKHQEAECMRTDIEAFDEKLRRTLPPSKSIGDVDEEQSAAGAEVAALPSDPLDLIKPSSNDDYVNRIRNRLNEDATAREEREKRRRKVLVDQLKAHEAQEEARREEILVGRLMRQSQQERRIAVQLLHARHEKEVIRSNRMSREKENQARRLKEFEEALNREAEMARLAKVEYAEQTKKDRELHEQIMAERAEARYAKHYEMSADILSGIVDYSTKVAEYRELTNKLVPAKLMRDWTSMFVSGQPLYEIRADQTSACSEPTPEQILEEERQQLLDEGDFEEYRNMIGEWQAPEASDLKGPPKNNPIVGHIVQRLFNIVHPPTPPPVAPEFPPFPIKACVLGKTFAGKSSVCRRLAEYHRLQILNVDDLVAQAVEAHKNGEVLEIEPEEEEVEVTVTPAEDNELTMPTTAEAANTNDNDSSGGRSKQGSAKQSELAADPKSTEARLSSAGTTITAVTKPDEGMEKSDPEKPVVENEETEVPATPATDNVTVKAPPSSQAMRRTDKRYSKSKGPPKPQPTPRAKLGMKAMKVLKRGRGVDDALAVDILVEAIRRLPESTGWVLDSFPATYAQAKLLEKSLSGFDAPSREPSKHSLKSSKGKKSVLAPDPRPVATPSEPASGINVVILFDLPHDLCLKRSAGRTCSMQSEEKYHQEFRPPPEGSMTGVGKAEKVMEVQDPAYDQQQIQHRLTSFQDAWPKLEKWYSKFGTLRCVDANQELETVFLEVEKILEDTLNKLMGKDQPEVFVVEEDKEEKAEEPEKPPEPPVEVPPETPKEDRSRPTSKKGSRSGSAKRSGSRGSADKKGKKSPATSPSKDSGKKSAKSSRGSSPKSPKGRKSGKKTKTPEPEPEPEPEVPPGTPPPQPGSDEWEYVDQPIDEELAHILSPNWENIETAYIGNSKEIFRKIRDERDLIIKYFYQIKKDYLAYLRRPDHKQEFVSQWQKDFNDVSDELRDDEEMRAELHQQVDDLRERLWSICDERKESAEREREMNINDGWVEDNLGILSNHYITLMQAEVDRFQDTVRLLKDYYRGMDGKIPDELSSDFIRIPLVELPVTERAGSPTKSEAGSEVGSKAASVPTSPAPGDNTDVKSVPSKAGTPSGKRGKKGAPDTAEETAAVTEATVAGGDEPKRTKIPLVPRRPLSPDAAAAGAKGKTDKAKVKGAGGGKDDDGPQPPTDLDEKLLYDAYQMGYSAIDKVHHHMQKLSAEQAAREAEEEAEKEKEREKELEKQKAAMEAKKKGKKGDKGGKKSRSPSPKKGKGKDTPTVPITPPASQEEETEEDKEKKKVKDQARHEFMSATHEEATAAKSRMELIRIIGSNVLQDLKSKADSSYLDMNDWLGARFLKEMESIDLMSEVARGVIEEGTRLHEELIINQEDFLISQDVKVLRTPSPLPRPPPLEPVMSEAFTVNQVIDLYQQFSQTAPSGMIALKNFQEIFTDVSCLTHGTEQIPDIWMNVHQEKLEQMSMQLSPDGEYLDWRAFLLQAAQPWPIPTQADLLETLQNFNEMDQKNLGYVTKEQYDRVNLWFRGHSRAPPTPVDPAEPLPYDRLENLKQAFFDLFADHSSKPSKLDYTTMLLYFSSAPDPYEGFLRALSVAAGTHMPRLPGQSLAKKSSRPASQASLVPSAELEGDKLASEDLLMSNEEIPESAINATVPLDALDMVLHHGQSMRGDSHRFSVTSDPEDAFSRERLAGIYQELGADNLDPVALSVLVEHPVLQDMLASLITYKAADLKTMLTNTSGEILDIQSLKTIE